MPRISAHVQCMWPHHACAVQPAATNSHPSVAAAVAAAGGGGRIQQHTIQAGSSARLAVLRLTLPQLGYDNMTGHEVLRQLLPAEVAQAQAALPPHLTLRAGGGANVV